MKLSEARILFVDDEPFLLEIFAQWISGETPCQVTTAADGQEALETLKTNDYDLLITDVNMPRVNGPELVRRMTATGKIPPSILFVSGFGDVDQREMYGLGVEAFLAKPVPREMLLTSMRQALAERAELWRTPFDAPPRHALQLQADDFSDSVAGGNIGIGRGGFSAPYLKPIAPGKVRFDCHLSMRGLNLSGEGYVRWKSKSEGTIGIELTYLEASSRAIIADEINTRCPKAFVPSR